MARYHLRASLTREAFPTPRASGDGLKLVERADNGTSIGIRAGSPNGCPADDPEGGR